jgi:indole-3-glycerol phosphate synthase
MSGILHDIARASLERVEQARRREPEAALWRRAADLPPAPALKLHPDKFDIIAELKLRSPAVGALAGADADIESRVTAYARGGAAAVSVLTEPTRFDGDLQHLARASAALTPLGVPAMRKDFLVDHYQVMEARAHGAGGVLVILRLLDHGRIVDLLDCAAMLKMFVLLEGFDEQDMALATRLVEERTDRVEQLLVGLNSRDLDTLEVVPERLESLVDKLPDEVPRVAESGVATAEDAARLAGVGYRMALVGRALMAQEKPETLIRAMLTAGRERDD